MCGRLQLVSTPMLGLPFSGLGNRLLAVSFQHRSFAMSSSPARPVVAIRVFAFDASGRILLLRRASSEYGEGQWCLPGGKLDYGDTPEGTVDKELAEETSLTAKGVTFLFYQNSPPIAAGKMHCLNLYFRCTAVGNVSLNEESSAFVWLSLAEALAQKPIFGGCDVTVSGTG
jgi:8-oxo-dGTP diphosphatase